MAADFLGDGCPTFFILTALAETSRHGCGIIGRVGELSDGAVKLGPGTMCGALDRLVDQELVVLDREEVQAGRLRRYHRLTPRGRTELAAEVRRLERDSRVGQVALGVRLEPLGTPGSTPAAGLPGLVAGRAG